MKHAREVMFPRVSTLLHKSESWLKAKDYSLNWCGLQKVSFLGYYPLALYRLRWIRLLKIFICVEESHVQLGQHESKR